MSRIDPDSYLDDEPSRSRRRRRAESAMMRSPRAKPAEDSVVDEIAKEARLGTLDAEGTFNPTFSSSHWERWWIYNCLGPFFYEGLITDVLRQVRGGKEATVYCCAAHPATGRKLVAVKLYRPRQTRSLRNDARYRQGRQVLDEYGTVVHDRRLLVALRKGTSTGKELQHTSWLQHEYRALQLLYDAGADVPQPLACRNNTILMEYLGDEARSAPTLNEVRLAPGEAKALYARLLHNVDLMLAGNLVHGDLSAYNVLYWEGEFRVIDFPQAVDARTHPEAFAIFQRDLARLCRYFARYRLGLDAAAIAREMWARHRLPVDTGPTAEELWSSEQLPAVDAADGP